MNTDVTLGTGQTFHADIENARVGAHRMALAYAVDHDPARGVSNAQAMVTMDDSKVLRKTLRVDGFTAEAVLEFGEGLGDGALSLRWTALPEPDAVIIHGHGRWNETPLAAFAQRVSLDGGPIARNLPVSFADGTPFTAVADRATAAVLADFARCVSLSARRAIGLGRALANHFDPCEVVSPLWAARSVILESLALGASALTFPTPSKPAHRHQSGAGEMRFIEPSVGASVAQAGAAPVRARSS